MSGIPTVAMQFVAGVVQTAAQAGIEQQTILDIAGLTVEELNGCAKQFPLPRYIQLLEEIATLSQDNFFGLHHGLAHKVSDFGALGYILLNSASVGCALNSLIRYFNTWQQATEVTLTLEDDIGWLSYRILDNSIKARRQDAEAAGTTTIAILRTLTRQPWHPKAVWLEHESPLNQLEYERVLNAPLFFNQPINAIAIERELLEQKIPFADLGLLPMLEKHLQMLISQREAGSELIALVTQAIVRSLPTRCPTLAEIAGGLGLSSRTLQRHLGNCNVTFEQLIGETRHQLALIYLQDPKLSLAEVALLLGYSELSAFNHAFRRWRNCTPRQYRQFTSNI